PLSSPLTSGTQSPAWQLPSGPQLSPSHVGKHSASGTFAPAQSSCSESSQRSPSPHAAVLSQDVLHTPHRQPPVSQSASTEQIWSQWVSLPVGSLWAFSVQPNSSAPASRSRVSHGLVVVVCFMLLIVHLRRLVPQYRLSNVGQDSDALVISNLPTAIVLSQPFPQCAALGARAREEPHDFVLHRVPLPQIVAK